MQQRIQELAEQARKHFPKTESSGEFWVFDEQKFAELIIEECSQIILDWKSEPFPMDPEFAARLIKEHFGLKL